MAIPGEIPVAKPIVTETLFVQGANADLSGHVIEEQRERDYIRGMNSADRAKLRTNITAWEATKGVDASMQEVKTLLTSLKTEIDKSETGSVGKGVEWTIENSIGSGGMAVVEGLKKIPTYARDEAMRVANAGTMQEKIGIVGKNALLVGMGYTAYKILNWMTSGIDKSVEKGGLSYYGWHLLKWTGILAATGGLANMFLGKPPEPLNAPPVAEKKTINTKETTMDGQNLLTAFLSAARIMDVTLDDGTTMSILDPVNTAERKLEAKIRIGSDSYLLTPDVKGTPLDMDPDKKEKPIDEIPVPDRPDPLKKLELISRVANVEKRGPNVVANWPNLLPPGTNSVTIGTAQLTGIAQEIRDNKDAVVLHATHTLTPVLGVPKTTDFRFPILVKKLPKNP